MADAITVHCPSCETAFPVDPEKVPEGGVNARCSECKDIFRVDTPDSGMNRETEAAGEPGGAEDLPGFDVSEPRVEAGEEALPELETGEVEAPEAFDSEDAAEGAGEDEDEGEEWAEEYLSTTGSEEGGLGEAGGTAATGLTELEELEEEKPQSDELEEEPLPRMEETGIAGPELDTEEVETPEVAGMGREGDAGLDMESTGIDTEAPAEALEEPAPGREALEAETGELAAEAGDEERDSEPSPAAFGNRSPEEKAQRLARVLVSDMITYNPNMYETALARGTLKEDFAEEIEKSWEEYVEQVGEELATSTSHWTDALNDILAKGENTF